MPAMTLADVAAAEKDALKKFFIVNLLRRIAIMNFLPWQNVSALKNIAIRWRSLPDVAFRKINGAYSASQGAVDDVWESVYGFGGDMQFDNVFTMTSQAYVTDPKKLQTDMKLEAMKIKFNDYFINGDHGVDPDGFEGLKKRIANSPARQTIYFAAAASAGLDPTASIANAQAFVNGLEEQHYKTNGGMHNAWFGHEGMKWGLGRVIRYAQASGGNWLGTTKDMFDREYPTWWGSPFLDVGLKADQSTEIITATEAGGTGTANTTSVYAASFEEEQGIQGMQLNPLNVYDPLKGGEMPTAPATLLRVDWWIGLTGFGSFGITRGRNVELPANWT